MDGVVVYSRHNSAYPSQSQFQSHNYQDNLPVGPEADNGSTFLRMLMVLTVVLVFTMCGMKLVTWFLFGARLPQYHLKSLKFSNSSTMDPANWLLDLSIVNTNRNLAIQFEGVAASMLYRGSMIVNSSLNSFRVSEMQQYSYSFNIPASKDLKYEDGVLHELGEDLRNGKVILGLKMAMNATFKTPDLVYRRSIIDVFCDDLKVVFSSVHEGDMIPGLANTCLISFHKV